MPLPLLTVKTTVAVLFDELAATFPQLVPVPLAGAQLTAIPGPTRASTVTAELVLVPAVAVTDVF